MLTNNTINATTARKNFFSLTKSTIKYHQHQPISTKEGIVVMISGSEYEELMETAQVLNIPGILDSLHEADKDIKKGDIYSFDEIFS